jgi:hypothetical protein
MEAADVFKKFDSLSYWSDTVYWLVIFYFVTPVTFLSHKIRIALNYQMLESKI